MRRATKLMKLQCSLPCFLFFITNPGATDPASVVPQAAEGSIDSLACTVRAVDVEARTLEALTGVGHALRMVRMQVAPSCDITMTGVPVPLGALRAGAVVLVLYRIGPEAPPAPGARVAYAIETLPIETMGDVR